MRVLFLSNVFPNWMQPERGTFNRAMIAGLARQHRVRVLSPISWRDELAWRWHHRSLARRPADFAAVPTAPADYPRFYYPPGILRAHFGQFMWWSLRHQLRSTMEGFRPDAIVSYWAHPDGEVAVRAAQRAGIPAIVMVGGSDVLLLARSGARRKTIMSVLHQADAVVTVSRHIAETLTDDGISPDKLHVIYRGVDLQRFHSRDREGARQKLELPDDARVLVSVGRLVTVKGFETLIEARRRLPPRHANTVCYVLGEGPLRGALARQIEECGLKDVVRLCGSQRHESLADWYRAADLTVLPSLSEGVPNVLLESMSCGTPFVASRVGGIPEISDEQHDRLVPPGDPQALADAITSALDQPPAATPRQFMPWSWDESTAALCQIIEGDRTSDGETDEHDLLPVERRTNPPLLLRG